MVQVSTIRQVWDATLGQNPAAWYYKVPDDFVAALKTRVGQLPTATPMTQMRLTDQERSRWSGAFERACDELEHGRGFIIFDRLPLERLTAHEATALYWLIGQLLGEPFEQNVEGTLLYDVRDTGQNVASGARFSVTNYESSFHTDNSFGERVLDYVGLLCLQTAKAGGLSQGVSAYTVLEVLRREHPAVLETLSREFLVDRRGGVRDGEASTVRRPIFAWDDAGLLVRYLRYWIEVGHEKAGEPLTIEQRQALDVLDEVLQRPELRIEFALQPGQMYFINNRWTLHNRTAFTDDPDPQRRRHLVRLWLAKSPTLAESH